MKKAYVFLAEGFEEVEALTVVDLLRRANVELSMVSISQKKSVTGAHGIVVEADVLYEQANMEEANALILPGGMPGTRNLQAFVPLNEALKAANAQGKLVCAICAAPLVLGQNGILQGKKACCYPGFEEELLGATVCYEPAVKDGNTITSRGVGTAIAFACEIIAELVGREIAEEIKKGICA